MAGRKRRRLAERRRAVGLSQERLAEAVGVDVTTAARWERGETDPQPVHRPRLAAALKVSVEEIGELLAPDRSGSHRPRPAAADSTPASVGDEHGTHLHAWGALRTLEEIGVFVRSDMLSRRDILAASVTMVTGSALVEPVARFFDTVPAGLPASNGGGLGRIGMSEVESLERSVQQFVAIEAATGGGVVREAAVGQLKYTVDLAQYASYSEAVGNRLLTVIAHMASRVGFMSHDAGMDGPAQRYFWYALRAAHEAGTERARLRSVGTLANLARQAHATGHLSTALRVLDRALDRVPEDPRRFNAVRAELVGLKASMLSGMGAANLSEVDSYVHRSFDLLDKAREDEYAPAVAEYFSYANEAELASVAAGCYRDLIPEDPRLAARAEDHASQALASRGDGFARSKVFDQVTLARIRFRAGETEQGCLDGQQAIQMAAAVSGSARIRTQLAHLMADAAPHNQRPAVRDLREQLSLAVAGSS